MNIVLIGYRCTGKSSIGKRIAERLKWSFVDTDELIEKKAKARISEIVENFGWEGFRKKEQEVIREVSCLNSCVIATGGGVVLNEENIRLLKKNGWIVWLKARPETIKKRMITDTSTNSRRPALKGGSSTDEVEQVLKERAPLYEKACDFFIDTDNLSPDKLCDIIVEKFKRIKDAG